MPDRKKLRSILLLEGVAHDGRKRIIDFLRRTNSDKLQVEEIATGGEASKLIRVSGPDLPFALSLLDDYHAVFARSLNKDAGAPQHRKALDYLPPNNASAILAYGYKPPWIQAALAGIPSNACAFVLGEIPAEWRKRLTEKMKLRACPRTFVLHGKRDGAGVVLSLRLNLDKGGDERLLLEDLNERRLLALEVLKDRFPALKKEMESLRLLRGILNSTRWKASRGSVQTEIRISKATWNALGKSH